MAPPKYDPDVGPDPLEWLGLTEGERILVVEVAHRRIEDWHPAPKNMARHARMHVAVENRLAFDEPPQLEETLERLQKEGLNRHAAIHAVGSVVQKLVRRALREASEFDEEACAELLLELRADDWPRLPPEKRKKKRKKKKKKKAAKKAAKRKKKQS